MLYNKKGQRCRVLSTFLIGDKHYSRIKLIANSKEEVSLTSELSEERVVSERTSFVVGENEKPSNIKTTEELLEAVEEPVGGVEEIEELVETDRLIEATNAHKKVFKVKESELEAFCLTRRLDYEAVSACLRGEQKTHRKWGFAYLD